MNDRGGASIDQIEFSNAYLEPGSNDRQITVRVIHDGGNSEAFPNHMKIYQVTGKFLFEPQLTNYSFDTQRFSIDLQPKHGNAPFIHRATAANEPAQRSEAELRRKAEERSVPVVAVSTPSVQQSMGLLDLPGRLDAYYQAALFARVSGYVASRKADIGTRVKTGDVLAAIDAPDLDQQLFQAQSDLNNAQANAALADVTNQRYQALLPNNYVTHQAADEKASDVTAKTALVKSAQANVDRLKALSVFKRIVAPFDGIVTVRNTDVGNLINTGSATGSEMFVVADIHKLRLYVNVPQNYVPRTAPRRR